ncbi:MAG: hypothetical protein DRJ60_00455 [Thermoprotei archaeon]|nr:MAG: hypothetical protein DRJ60_00455 [Thermoprotei archaeon]
MSNHDLINKFFDVVHREGLGKVFRCKICYNRFNKEFIVVGLADAKRHIEAHNNKQVYYDDVKRRPIIEKRITLKEML